MKILWLTGIPMPNASKLMLKKECVTGGWLVNLSHLLSLRDDVKMSIAFPSAECKGINEYFDGKINHYAIPSRNMGEFDNSIEGYFAELIEREKPDVVHIHGTEYPHSLEMVNACNIKDIKFIISIQGLVSVIAKHYMACLPEKVQNGNTFRDFIKQDNLKQQQKKFADRGKFEIEAIKKAKHIIGRTDWDRACTSQINPSVRYHFCNETLRDEFYKHEWSLDKCERYSIFISQASYPIKGLHFMLEAMPLILKRFPDTKLYIAGSDITKSDTLKDKLRKSSYAKYIEELLKKFNLKDNVIFTGLLDEKLMCARYLKSNVFVCPSSIENSPNSLGEAMILGVPCVASDVGGVADMLKHKEEGFVYQHDAPYMLAYYVCKIFGDEELACKFSQSARAHALQTHDIEKNLKTLINIYKEVIGE